MSENKVVYMDIEEFEEELDVLVVAEQSIKKLMAEVKMLREENKRYKKALEEYAEYQVAGTTARAALRGGKP